MRTLVDRELVDLFHIQIWFRHSEPLVLVDQFYGLLGHNVAFLNLDSPGDLLNLETTLLIVMF